jgi:hypothetical protein
MEGKGKPIFENNVSLMVYPQETILAEKLQTILARKGQNSRMKDYYDSYFILRNGSLEMETVKAALKLTFEHRKTDIAQFPLRFSEVELTKLEKYWASFYKGLRKNQEIPASIKDVIDVINKELELLGIF